MEQYLNGILSTAKRALEVQQEPNSTKALPIDSTHPWISSSWYREMISKWQSLEYMYVA